MTYIICYDVSENKIRKRVAKYLESVGYRLQHSVFRFEGSEAFAEVVRSRLLSLTEDAEAPRLLVAPMCAACAERIWQTGSPLEQKLACIIA